MKRTTPEVGPRIREWRERRGLSLRGLAEACELSVNAISMIERGESSPRVASLHLLAQALNVDIVDFFDKEDDRSLVVVRRGEGTVTGSSRISMTNIGSGLRNQEIEPFVVTVAAGDDEPCDPVQHPGQEFVYCLTGSITYRVGDEAHTLNPGDSLLFDATQPHSFGSASDAESSFLLVLQSSRSAGMGRDRHMPRSNGDVPDEGPR